MRASLGSYFKVRGLTQWGRKPGFVAPKPLSDREIAKLGDVLDEAERVRYGDETNDSFVDGDESRHAFHVAKGDYGDALTARNIYHQVEFENSERTPTTRERNRYQRAERIASLRFDEIEAARECGLATEREFLDAHAAHCQAAAFVEIVSMKYLGAIKAPRRIKSVTRYVRGPDGTKVPCVIPRR